MRNILEIAIDVVLPGVGRKIPRNPLYYVREVPELPNLHKGDELDIDADVGTLLEVCDKTWYMDGNFFLLRAETGEIEADSREEFDEELLSKGWLKGEFFDHFYGETTE